MGYFVSLQLTRATREPPASGKDGGGKKRTAFSSKPKVVRERVGRKNGKFSDNLG
jgi:hypothetical protein